MNEPVIVYTLFALVATGTSALLIGAVGGWFARQIQDQQQLSLLQERLERRQINSTELNAELEFSRERLEEMENVARLQGKRDRIIKDLLKKQNQYRKQEKEQKSDLEKTSKQVANFSAQLAGARKELTNSTVKLRILHKQHDELKKKFAASQQLASEIASQSASQSAPVETVAATQEKPIPAASASVVVKVEADPAKAAKAEADKATAAKTAAATGAKVSVQGQRPADKSSAPQLKVIDGSGAPKNDKTGADKPKNSAVAKEAAATTPTKTAEPAAAATPSKKEAPVPSASKGKDVPKSRKAAARVKDDLKKIKGIGPAIEVALNKIGIERYEQLAGLDAKAVRELDTKLAKFSGRIARDNWVGSAKQLRKKLSA